MWERLCYCIW